MANAYSERLRSFKGEPIRQWMSDHFEIPVVAVGLYLIVVLWVPEHFMKNRQPYNLKKLNTLWNLLLTSFSFVGAYYCLPMIYKMVFGPPYEVEYEFQPGVLEKRVGSLYMGVCKWNGNLFFNGEVGLYVVLFILSKIPEMIDTVFLVFQKKSIPFLHWYHHISVMLYCWHSYVHTISSGLIFAGMNYGVHSVMYLYYFLSTLGYGKRIRPFAPIITFLQIAQMVVGLAVELYSLYHIYLGRGCDANKTNIRLGTVMYVSYAYLFTKMFTDRYIRKKHDAKQPEGGEKAGKKSRGKGSETTNGHAAHKKRQ